MSYNCMDRFSEFYDDSGGVVGSVVEGGGGVDVTAGSR